MRVLVMILAVFVALSVGAQNYYENAQTMVVDTVGTLGTTVATQYFGWAQTSKYTDADPSTSGAIWKVRKITYDAAGELLTLEHARPTGGKLYGNVWTNRVNLTYH